ncbi:MAG: OmpA family protein [Myxococcales bacterium]|nr:OmpA family protein [Myxococcales bacterium]
MIRAALLAALFAHAPSRAAAQPVMIKVQNQVPAGKRPTLTVSAVIRVSDLELTLTRAEGGTALGRHPGLRGGQSFAFPIGDGAPGRSHYQGTLKVAMESGESWQSDLTFETVVVAEPKITLAKFDLEKNLLDFSLSRSAKNADLTVIDENGKTIDHVTASFEGALPEARLQVGWNVQSTEVTRFKLRVTDVDGFASNGLFTSLRVEIPHDEVNFASGSAVIEDSERAKLDEAYRRIVATSDKAKRFVRCRLLVQGHTDTLGTKEKNQRLSSERATAIALYFKKKGLPIPVSGEGHGEDRPRVKTPDETDERANRRVDYVLTADQAGASTTTEWKGR